MSKGFKERLAEEKRRIESERAERAARQAASESEKKRGVSSLQELITVAEVVGPLAAGVVEFDIHLYDEKYIKGIFRSRIIKTPLLSGWNLATTSRIELEEGSFSTVSAGKSVYTNGVMLAATGMLYGYHTLFDYPNSGSEIAVVTHRQITLQNGFLKSVEPGESRYFRFPDMDVEKALDGLAKFVVQNRIQI